MASDPYMHGVLEDDLAIYQFDSLGQDSDLAHLLDDTDNDLNDETFGGTADDAAPSRDFDFAGSTSRFLGADQAPAAQAGAKLGYQRELVPLSSDWGADPLLAPSAAPPRQAAASPWTSLNDDPLLSRAPASAYRAPTQSNAAPAQQQQAQPAARQVKTLEEVEAEMRAQSSAARQTAPSAQQQAAMGVASSEIAGQPMTLEQVEADLLRRRQAEQHQQQQQQQQATAPQQQQQQSGVPQIRPGMSPQPQAAFPPGMPPAAGPAMFLGNLPPQVLQTLPPQFPSLPPHIQHQLVAQRMAAFGHPLPPPAAGMAPGMAGPNGQPFPGSAGAFPPGMVAPSPRMMSPAHAQANGSPVPLPQHLVSPGGVAHPGPGPSPGTPGPGFPPLGAAAGPGMPGAGAGGEPNMLSTLFPPLPSQPGTIASVERQLEMLSQVGHAQHPSLMGAQLQALLQHAHAVVADVGNAANQGGSEGAADAPQGAADEADVEAKKRKAEELVRAVERRIFEYEEAEQRRKRKAMKIASMAKHNNLMSNSDKDFITRIQVSQLLTDDPYADDFYFHIMAAIKASRQSAALAAVGGGAGGAGGPAPQPGFPTQPNNGVGQGNRRPNRRDNAMNRMAQNVQRLVDNAKKRSAHESHTLSLDGALGKIATRTRSAPRPLLQVRPSSQSTTALAADERASPPGQTGTKEPIQTKRGVSTGKSLLSGAGLITSASATSTATSGAPASANGPLTYRQALAIIEEVYDCVLDLEQLRRIQPALLGAETAARAQYEQMTVEGEVREQVRDKWDEAKTAVAEGEAKYAELVARLWDSLHVMDPLDACTPHPFVALLAVPKGIRILPRAIRHLSAEQTLTLLTLLVATFDTLSVVQEAVVLDQLDTTAEGRQRHAAVEAKTESLLNALIAPIMAVVGQAQLRMVTGMLGLLMDRNDLLKVIRSKPGLAFLTILLSRAESLKQGAPAPEAADLEQWTVTFTHLFMVLSSGSALLTLFPSSRLAAALPFGVAQYQSLDALRPGVDADDEPVWRFLASVAVGADADQQQTLVTGVRDKVIENVRAARQMSEVKATQAASGAAEKAAMKIRNVNLLLNALSLDASMIETE